METGNSVHFSNDSQQRDDLTIGDDSSEQPKRNETCLESSSLHILLVTVYIVIAVCGSAGNILSFVVLHWKSCRSATNILLKGLSVVDTIFLFCAILRIAFMENSAATDCDSIAKLILGNLAVRYIMSIAQFMSVWIIVVLAFFRYMAICSPFRVTQWCNRHIAKRSFVVVAIMGILIWTPYLVQHDVTRKNIAENSTRTCYEVVNRKWTNTTMYKLYDGAFAHIGSMFIIPFIALLVFNTGMMRELYCLQAKTRDHLRIPKRTNEVMDITKVVIAIVIVFVISYSMYFLFTLHSYTPLMHDLFQGVCNKLFMFIIRTVALLNSSVNFIIYYILRKSFRRKVWMLLCACLGPESEPNGEISRVASRYYSHSNRSNSYNKSLRRYTTVKRPATPPKLRRLRHNSNNV